MSRLINADTLMKAMYHRAFETDGDTMWQSGCWVRYRAIEQVVKEQPTIEERRTGKTIVKSTGYRGYWACDQCGTQINSTDNFCRYCGADLRGEQE